MLTRLEQELAELAIDCLPRIATALESIAESLEALSDTWSNQPNPEDEYDKTGD